jgi:hypothetical protein
MVIIIMAIIKYAIFFCTENTGRVYTMNPKTSIHIVIHTIPTQPYSSFIPEYGQDKNIQF